MGLCVCVCVCERERDLVLRDDKPCDKSLNRRHYGSYGIHDLVKEKRL